MIAGLVHLGCAARITAVLDLAAAYCLALCRIPDRRGSQCEPVTGIPEMQFAKMRPCCTEMRWVCPQDFGVIGNSRFGNHCGIGSSGRRIAYQAVCISSSRSLYWFTGVPTGAGAAKVTSRPRELSSVDPAVAVVAAASMVTALSWAISSGA